MARKKYNRTDKALMRYQYNLDARNPFVHNARTYEKTDPHPWLDIHYGLEIGIVLKGSVRRFWGTVKKDLTAGDIWLCDEREPHGYQVVAAPCDIVCTIVRPGLFRDLKLPDAGHVNWLAPFQVPPRQRAVIPSSQRDEALDIGRKLWDLNNRNDFHSRLNIQVLLIETLLLLIQDQNEPEPESIRPHRTTRSAISDAVQLAQQSRRLVSTQQAAAVCKLSADRFSRLFAQEMGISFAKFALRCRINGAASDLVLTDLPVKAIAMEWEFTDESHLHRVFRRHFGCSPRTYRIRNRSRSRKRP